MTLPVARTRVAVPLVILLTTVCACGVERTESVCVTDTDCAFNSACIAGTCVLQSADAGETSPPPPPTCSGEWCGPFCCPSGTECRNAQCVPACESGLWCGALGSEVCCAVGLECRDRACVPPPPPPPSCPDGEVWDEALAACAAPVPVTSCERVDTGWHEPTVAWTVSPSDGYAHVTVTPVVIDLNGDGASDVVAPFYSEEGGYDGPAVVRALSGLDGSELWSIPPTAKGLSGVSQLAAGVLDLQVGPVIVGVDLEGRLTAFRGSDGARLWRATTTTGEPAWCSIGWGAPTLVDLDADTSPEILCGFDVYDRNGVRKWSGAEVWGPLGSIVVTADLNQDGKLDVTDGTRAYRHDGVLLWSLPGLPAGLPAVADVLRGDGFPGPDGFPELIVVRHGQLELRDVNSGVALLPPLFLPSSDGFSCFPQPAFPGVGGPPAVGDLNGDRLAEVVVGSGECLAALSVRRVEGVTEWYQLWSRSAVDSSSASTAAALFDFDADGWMDVVYADETVVHFVNGSHGAPRHEASHCSGSIYEGPVVADVDGDGSANVVLVRNSADARQWGCDPAAVPGITVLREARGRWANARSIWNQHAYSITHVCDGADAVCASLGPQWGAHGVVPMETPRGWLFEPIAGSAPYNALRANTHAVAGAKTGANAYITHVLPPAANDCASASTVQVRVANSGGVPLRAGTVLRLVSTDGELVSSVITSRPLLPGRAEILTVPWTTFGVTVTAFIDARDETSECDEVDNAFGPVELPSCPPRQAKR